MSEDNELGSEVSKLEPKQVEPKTENRYEKRRRELKERIVQEFEEVKERILRAQSAGEELDPVDRLMELGKFDTAEPEEDKTLFQLMQDLGVEDDDKQRVANLLDNSAHSVTSQGYEFPTKFDGVRFEILTVTPKLPTELGKELGANVSLVISPSLFSPDTAVKFGASVPRELPKTSSGQSEK